MSWVLPPDATPGSDLRLDIYWHMAETGCDPGLLEEISHGSRVGESAIAVSATEIVYVPADPIAAHEMRMWPVLLTTPGGFDAGDIVKYGIFRSTLGNECTHDVFIDGARVIYDYG